MHSLKLEGLRSTAVVGLMDLMEDPWKRMPGCWDVGPDPWRWGQGEPGQWGGQAGAAGGQEGSQELD